MTTKDIIEALREKKDFPAFRVGDTLRVHVKIIEGEKERIQIFEGIVIKKKGGQKKEASFTVRKVSYGIGVERIFPYESSAIDKVEIVKHGRVRRSKLFYLRDRQGRAAQVAEKDMSQVDKKKTDAKKTTVETVSDSTETPVKAAAAQ